MLNNFEYLFWIMIVFFITPLIYTTLMTTNVVLGFKIYISTLKLVFHKYRHEQHLAITQQHQTVNNESLPLDFLVGRSVYFSNKNNKQKYFVYKRNSTKQDYSEMYL